MKASTFCSLKVSHRLSKSACAHKASWTIITLMNRPCSRAMDSMEEMEEIGPKNLRPPAISYGARTAGSQCACGVGGAVAELVSGGLDSRTGGVGNVRRVIDHTGDGLVADSGELGHFEHGRTFAWLAAGHHIA